MNAFINQAVKSCGQNKPSVDESIKRGLMGRCYSTLDSAKTARSDYAISTSHAQYFQFWVLHVLSIELEKVYTLIGLNQTNVQLDKVQYRYT